MNNNTRSDTPIACSPLVRVLDRARRLVAQAIHQSLVSRERVPGGLRLTVHPSAASALSKLVDLERQCCPWITLLVKGESLTMTTDGEGESVLAEMFS